MRYPGGKGKCFQHIVNLLPPHTTYIETHLGGGAVLRNKKPSAQSIGIDCDPRVIQRWREEHPSLAQYIAGDAIEFLKTYQFTGSEVVYCDPPYLARTRRRTRVYRFDYSDDDHFRLLDCISSLPCQVVISGYPSALYSERLQHWNSRTYFAKAHDSRRLEQLWFNYAAPEHLHDSRYMGGGFREREIVRRRLNRLKARISGLSSQERHHIAEWIVGRLADERAP